MAGTGEAMWVTSWRISLCQAVAVVGWGHGGVLPRLPLYLSLHLYPGCISVPRGNEGMWLERTCGHCTHVQCSANGKSCHLLLPLPAPLSWAPHCVCGFVAQELLHEMWDPC